MMVFLSPHFKALQEHFDVYGILGSDNEITRKIIRSFPGVKIAVVPMRRSIAPIYDLISLLKCCYQLKVIQPDVLHSVTPKAGMIGMISGFFCGIPYRLHTFTGQVWATRRGLMRCLLKTIDRLVVRLSTNILVDSVGQQEFLQACGILKKDRSTVIAAGSICGVDLERFRPSLAARKWQRRNLGTKQDSIVCLYLGRLNREKGVFDLVDVSNRVLSVYPDVEFWLVGPQESGDQINFGSKSDQGFDERIKRIGFTDKPERFMQAADLFVLPSWREGFGLSVIEAAACGIPALVSDIYGLRDTVIEGHTGWRHKARDKDSLTEQLKFLLSRRDLLEKAGKAAILYARERFSQTLVTNATIDYYLKIVSKRNPLQ